MASLDELRQSIGDALDRLDDGLDANPHARPATESGRPGAWTVYTLDDPEQITLYLQGIRQDSARDLAAGRLILGRHPDGLPCALIQAGDGPVLVLIPEAPQGLEPKSAALPTT